MDDVEEVLGYIGDFIIAGFHAIGFFALCGFATMFGLKNQNQTSNTPNIRITNLNFFFSR